MFATDPFLYEISCETMYDDEHRGTFDAETFSWLNDMMVPLGETFEGQDFRGDTPLKKTDENVKTCVEVNSEVMVNAFEIMAKREIDCELLRSIVFGNGGGYYWIRQWFGLGTYGAPPIFPANLVHFEEFRDHPCVIESEERFYGECFAKGYINADFVPPEVNREQVMEIAILYGSCRGDLICLISNAYFADDVLILPPTFDFIRSPIIDPSPPIASGYADTGVQVVPFVPSLKSLCLTILPFGSGSEQSRTHYMNLFGVPEPPAPLIVPPCVAWPDPALEKIVVSVGPLLSVDGYGQVFSRGSFADLLSNKSKVGTDCDASPAVNRFYGCVKDQGLCDLNCREARKISWLVVSGLMIPYVRHHVMYVTLDPCFIPHRGWMSYLFDRMIWLARACDAHSVSVRFSHVGYQFAQYGCDFKRAYEKLMAHKVFVKALFKKQLHTTSFGYYMSKYLIFDTSDVRHYPLYGYCYSRRGDFEGDEGGNSYYHAYNRGFSSNLMGCCVQARPADDYLVEHDPRLCIDREDPRNTKRSKRWLD